MRLTVLSVWLATICLSSSLTSGQDLNKKSNGLSQLLQRRPLTSPITSMNATEIIEYYGYPYENHWVTTEDGYILNLIRIPHGRNGETGHFENRKDRPVALLQHGLLTNCELYLMNPRNKNLPFILADMGVDVWLGNNRGTEYAVNHTTLDPNTLEFWDFGWDEMAKYDLPAIINHIIEQAGVEQIYYIGTSQGTAIAFAEFSENQKLASKIKHFLALAPIARVGHSTTGLRYLIPFRREIVESCDLLFHGMFGLPIPMRKFIGEEVCGSWGEGLCESVLFFLIGDDPKELNTSRMDIYMSKLLSQTSARLVMQWAQGVLSNNFQKYDFGRDGNMKHYNQNTPPLYNVKHMKVPVAVFRGGKDALADPTDVAWLLPQINVTHDINIPYYNHADALVGNNAINITFPTILKIITGHTEMPKIVPDSSVKKGMPRLVPEPHVRRGMSEFAPEPLVRRGMSEFAPEPLVRRGKSPSGVIV